MIRKSLLILVVILLSTVPALAANDPYWEQQWGLHKIQAEPAWGAGTGAGITIAVIDTGVDYNHPDLRGKVASGYDFVSNDPDPYDETAGAGEGCPGNPGHGTHVAGIAGAITNNGVGVAGTAPGATILPVRVLNQRGCGFISDVNEGIRYAVQRGAHVINLSLGGDVVFLLLDDEEFNFKQALNDAWAKGVIPVVAAGNDSLPSGYTDVNALIVGATDRQDRKPYWASIPAASRWPIAAPGHEIVSSLPGNKVGSLSGTSMSAPHVAGAAAVLRGLGLNPQQTVDRIRSTADPVSDPTVGARRLNLGKAVQGLGGGGGSSGGGSGTAGSGSGTSGGGGRTGSTSSRGPSAPAAGQPSTTTAGSPPPTAAEDSQASPSPGSVLSADAPKKDRPSPLNVALVALVIAVGVGFVAWYGRQAFRSD